jgi:hypothetical protein
MVPLKRSQARLTQLRQVVAREPTGARAPGAVKIGLAHRAEARRRLPDGCRAGRKS